MAEGKITIEGDATGAIDAAEEATGAIAGLTGKVTELDEASVGVGEAGDKFAGSMGKMRSSARTAGSSIGSLSGNLGSVGSAIGQLHPQLGKATGAFGSLAGGVGSLTSLMTPAGLATAALGLAIGVAAKKMADAKEAAAQAEQAMVDYAVAINKVRGELALLQAPAYNAGKAIGALRDYSKEAGEAYDEYQDGFKRTDAIVAIEDLNVAYEDMEARYDKGEEVLKDLNKRLEENNKAMEKSRKNATQAGGVGRMWQKTLEEQEETNRRLTLSIDTVTLSQAKLSDEMGVAQRELEGVNEALDGLFRDPPEGLTGPVISKAADDWAGLADSILKAALVTGDFSEAISLVVENQGELGSEVTALLSAQSDEYLRQLGFNEELIEAIRERQELEMSGREMLRSGNDETLANIAEENAEREKALEAARKALELSDAKTRAESEQYTLAMQRADFDAQTYEQRKAYEEELLEQAMLAHEHRLAMTAEEARVWNQYHEEQRAKQQEAAESGEVAMAQFKENMKDMGTQAIAQGIGDLANAFGEMVASSGEAGDAMGKSAKDSVASIAKQFGSLFLTTGLGMVFMPGMQAQGAGLIAGGIALLAIGGAVGAAGKKGAAAAKSKDPGGGKDAGSQTVVVDTWETTSSRDPGRRARDSGDAADNADRYGINRSREWA